MKVEVLKPGPPSIYVELYRNPYATSPFGHDLVAANLSIEQANTLIAELSKAVVEAQK